jgi:hypothetical protein
MFMAAVSGALLHPFFVGHFYPVNPASNRIKSGVDPIKKVSGSKSL